MTTRLCACGKPVSTGRTTTGDDLTLCMPCDVARALADFRYTPKRSKPMPREYQREYVRAWRARRKAQAWRAMVEGEAVVKNNAKNDHSAAQPDAPTR